MRIVHLTRDLPPAPSGIGDHVARLARELSLMGDEQAIVCSGPADSLDGIDVRPSVGRWDRIEPIVAAVRDSRPDAIVWHYNPFQIGRRGIAPFAGRLARSLRSIAPLVVVAHELWYPWGRTGLRGVVWAVAQRAQVRGVLEAADRILVTTDERAAGLRARFPRKAEAIGVIAAGPTVEPSGDLPSSMNGTFVVAHLGAIGEGRDLRPALEAIGRLRASGLDVRLLLAGRTGIAPPAGAGIVATGPLDHQALSAALSSADAYLFAEPTGPTSRKTSLLSALAHGLPVVAYSGPNAEGHFRDGENVLLVSPDATSIESALRRLAGDPALRERLGRAAKQLAGERYSWRAIAERVRVTTGACVQHAGAGR